MSCKSSPSMIAPKNDSRENDDNEDHGKGSSSSWSASKKDCPPGEDSEERDNGSFDNADPYRRHDSTPESTDDASGSISSLMGRCQLSTADDGLVLVENESDRLAVGVEVCWDNGIGDKSGLEDHGRQGVDGLQDGKTFLSSLSSDSDDGCDESEVRQSECTLASPFSENKNVDITVEPAPVTETKSGEANLSKSLQNPPSREGLSSAEPSDQSDNDEDFLGPNVSTTTKASLGCDPRIASRSKNDNPDEEADLEAAAAKVGRTAEQQTEFRGQPTDLSSKENPTRASPLIIVYEQVECNAHWVRYKAMHQHNKTPISIREWAEALSQNSNDGRQNRWEFNEIIKNSPFQAHFFETKGTTHRASYLEGFEFVLVNAPLLHQFGARGSDDCTFSEHFDRAGSGNYGAVAFDNIGGDARLIAPLPGSSNCRGSAPKDYFAHLALFCRKASQPRVCRLWQKVTSEYLRRLEDLGDCPVWLSTSGLGVAWLHVRLDSNPKYYTYPPFKRVTGADSPQSTKRQKKQRFGKRKRQRSAV